MLQEPFKKLPSAITQHSGNPMQFYIDFNSSKKTPGPQQSLKSIRKTVFFEEIVFSARSWTRCSTLLASISGAFWPPRWLKPVSESVLERPRADQEDFFWSKSRPRAYQEASKTAPRGLQQAKKLQEASGLPVVTHFASMLDPIGTQKPSLQRLADYCLHCT